MPRGKRKAGAEAGTQQSPITDDTVLEAPEYEAEAIQGFRVVAQQRQYLVKWAGYPDSDSTWEPEENLTNCKKLFAAYKRARTQPVALTKIDRSPQAQPQSDLSADTMSPAVVSSSRGKLAQTSLFSFLSSAQDATSSKRSKVAEVSSADVASPTAVPKVKLEFASSQVVLPETDFEIISSSPPGIASEPVSESRSSSPVISPKLENKSVTPEPIASVSHISETPADYERILIMDLSPSASASSSMSPRSESASSAISLSSPTDAPTTTSTPDVISSAPVNPTSTSKTTLPSAAAVLMAAARKNAVTVSSSFTKIVSRGPPLASFDHVLVQDSAVPEARLVISRQQCEALREPQVAAGAAASQSHQHVQFDLSGAEFQQYLRPTVGAFAQTAATKFRITSKLDEIVSACSVKGSGLSDDPCLFRGNSNTASIVTASVAVPLVVRDMTDEQINCLTSESFEDSIEYYRIGQPANQCGADILDRFCTASKKNRGFRLRVTVLDSRPFFVTDQPQPLASNLTSNTGIWRQLYPDSFSQAELKAMDSPDEMSAVVRSNVVRPQAGDVSDTIAVKLMHGAQADSDRLGHSFPTAYVENDQLNGAIENLFNRYRASAGYLRHTINASMLHDGCSICIDFPSLPMYQDSFCRRNHISVQLLETLKSLQGTVVFVAEFVSARFEHNLTGSQFVLELMFDEFKVVKPLPCSSVANRRPIVSGDFVKLKNPTVEEIRQHSEPDWVHCAGEVKSVTDEIATVTFLRDFVWKVHVQRLRLLQLTLDTTILQPVVGELVRIQVPAGKREPTFGWGNCRPSSQGTLTFIKAERVEVKFDSNSKWIGLLSELRCCHDPIDLGSLVCLKVDADNIPFCDRWNSVTPHCVGRVIKLRHSNNGEVLAIVRFPHCQEWIGPLSTLSVVHDPELAFIADGPAPIAPANIPSERSKSAIVPHELFVKKSCSPFVYLQEFRHSWTDEQHFYGHRRLDAVSKHQSFADASSLVRIEFDQYRSAFREVAVAVTLEFDPFRAHLSRIPRMPSNIGEDFLSFNPFQNIVAPKREASLSWQDPVSKWMDALVHSSYAPDQTALQRNYGLNVALKPYQQQTVEWMISEEKHPHGFHRHFFSPHEFANSEGKSSRMWYSPTFSVLFSDSELPDRHGGVVCEEMGLGKTIEAIALIAANRVPRPQLNQLISTGGRIRHQSSATLVLVPPSLVGQWCEEFERRHTGNLRVLKFYGNKKPTSVAELLSYDVVLTTFQILTMDLGCSNPLLDLIHWHRLIVDEGHILRNGSTYQVMAINRLQAKNRWCLTGTPFSTSVKDEIPGYLDFLGLVPAFLNKDRDNETCAVVMRHMFMRHTKSQEFNGAQILNLPQLIETNIWLDFPPAQQSAYQRLYQMAKTAFQRYETAGKAVSKTLVVMQLLIPMRRACAGDTMNIAELEREFKGEEDRLKSIGFSAAEIAAGRQFLRTAVAAFNSDEAECPVCFEVMENPMQTPCRHVFCRDCICSIAIDSAKCPICRDSISISTLRRPVCAGADADPEASAIKAAEEAGVVNFDTKIKALLLELDKMKVAHPREKSLVFSQFATSMATIKARLTEKGIRWRSISGDMSADDRQKQIDFFNRDPPGSVFLLTMRTGAVGLTLTSATHVFIMDPALNPAMEQQAKNRVYRMGQTKDVYIKRFLVRGTVEENIDKLQLSRSDVDIERTSDRQQLRMNELRTLFGLDL